MFFGVSLFSYQRVLGELFECFFDLVVYMRYKIEVFDKKKEEDKLC